MGSEVAASRARSAFPATARRPRPSDPRREALSLIPTSSELPGTAAVSRASRFNYRQDWERNKASETRAQARFSAHVINRVRSESGRSLFTYGSNHNKRDSAAVTFYQRTSDADRALYLLRLN